MANVVAAPIYVQSPEIHEDSRVTFRYYAPAANDVKLVCYEIGNNQSLVRDKQGVWSITVGPLSPNTYPYHYLVDGAVVLDPVNRHTKPWLWVDSLLEVPGDNPATHQLQDVPHGQVHIRWYRSPRLQQTRRIFVYTPPGYNENDKKYPVLFLLHGCGDDESAWTQVGQVQHLADNLLHVGKIMPMVIVMPLGHDQLPTNPDFNVYDCLRNYAPVEKEFFEGVIPFAKAEYRLSDAPEDRAIAGLSMGGGQALRLGLTNTDRFGWVAGFSSAMKKHNLIEVVHPLLENIKQAKTWLWIGCGKQDFLFEDTVEFDKWLTDQNVAHTTVIDEGNHNWQTWRGYMTTVLQELFK